MSIISANLERQCKENEKKLKIVVINTEFDVKFLPLLQTNQILCLFQREMGKSRR